MLCAKVQREISLDPLIGSSQDSLRLVGGLKRKRRAEDTAGRGLLICDLRETDMTRLWETPRGLCPCPQWAPGSDDPASLQVHKHGAGTKRTGLCAAPVDIPTHHPEVPERNQTVTVRNTTELSKADKISL